jgi:hypothetical protein
MTQPLSPEQLEENRERLAELPIEPPSHAKHVASDDVLDLYCYAVRQGWRHETDAPPYENLHSLLRCSERHAVDRETIRSFAYAFICGYNDESARDGLAAVLENEDVTLKGADNE